MFLLVLLLLPCFVFAASRFFNMRGATLRVCLNSASPDDACTDYILFLALSQSVSLPKCIETGTLDLGRVFVVYEDTNPNDHWSEQQYDLYFNCSSGCLSGCEHRRQIVDSNMRNDHCSTSLEGRVSTCQLVPGHSSFKFDLHPAIHVSGDSEVYYIFYSLEYSRDLLSQGNTSAFISWSDSLGLAISSRSFRDEFNDVPCNESALASLACNACSESTTLNDVVNPNLPPDHTPEDRAIQEVVFGAPACYTATTSYDIRAPLPFYVARVHDLVADGSGLGRYDLGLVGVQKLQWKEFTCPDNDLSDDRDGCYDQGLCVWNLDKWDYECQCSGTYTGEHCEFDPNSLTTILVVSLGVGGPLVIGFVLCLGLAIFCAIRNAKRKVVQSKIANGTMLDEMVSEEVQQQFARITFNASLFEVSFDDVKVLKSIGQGGQSRVFRAEWETVTVAFKVFELNEAMAEEEKFSEFEKEVRLLRECGSHPSILECKGVAINLPRVGMVLEFCENGDLSEYLSSHPFDEIDYHVKLSWSAQISSGIAHLHSKNIIHRDIKSENVLLTKDLRCKIADLGISRVVEAADETKTRYIGTSVNMAPEVLSGNYDEKIDVFSFSIVLFQIFTGRMKPYGEELVPNIELKVAGDPNYRPQFTEEEVQWLGEGLISMVRSCWEHESSARPSAGHLSQYFERLVSETD